MGGQGGLEYNNVFIVKLLYTFSCVVMFLNTLMGMFMKIN